MNTLEALARRSRTVGGPRVDVAKRIAEWVQPKGECLLWMGARDKQGYGVIGIGRGTSFRVTRVAWELANGPIPEGQLVCHSCDNPSCLNLAHLFLGTAKDNTADMWAKKRHPVLRGERHPSCKLSDAQVEQIKALRSSGKTLNELAKQFGVTFQHISQLCRKGRLSHECA